MHIIVNYKIIKVDCNISVYLFELINAFSPSRTK